MNSLNRVQLIGNLGADPEVRRLENGVAVARIRIATSETYKDKEGKEQTITEWHSVVAWRGLAEVIEKYMHKGDRIFIEGKLSTRSYQADNGETRYTTEVKADNMIMLSGRREGTPGLNRPPMPNEDAMGNHGVSAPKSGAPMMDAPPAPSSEGSDDLPF